MSDGTVWASVFGVDTFCLYSSRMECLDDLLGMLPGGAGRGLGRLGAAVGDDEEREAGELRGGVGDGGHLAFGFVVSFDVAADGDDDAAVISYGAEV